MSLPEGFNKTLGELAQIGYEAYGNEAGWKNYEGNPLPRWEDLPEHTRTKWGVTIGAIAKALAGDNKT